MTTPLLSCTKLSIRVPARALLVDLCLDLNPGNLICMLGPNGVGKTLTLHALAGLDQTPPGTVRLGGSELATMRRREVARHIGLLLQDDGGSFPATVAETAMMGRHPYLPAFGIESDTDRACASRALAAVGLADHGSRLVTTLSGGERRRLSLARLLAQDPAVMLLDEPVNHLDPRHQVQVLGRLRDLAAQGKGIMISLHDPALAVQIACTVLLMFGDGRWLLGPAAEVVTAGNLERLFGTAYQSYQGIGDTSVLLPQMPARPSRSATGG